MNSVWYFNKDIVNFINEVMIVKLNFNLYKRFIFAKIWLVYKNLVFLPIKRISVITKFYLLVKNFCES